MSQSVECVVSKREAMFEDGRAEMSVTEGATYLNKTIEWVEAAVQEQWIVALGRKLVNK
jgi:hypothetical protein